MRTLVRAGMLRALLTAGLIAFGELADLLASDPASPQRLALLAVAVLAAVTAGCVAAAVPRLRDPGGRSRPRAPTAAPAAA